MISKFNASLMEILCHELQQRTANFKVIDCLSQDLRSNLRRFFLVLQGLKGKEALFFCFDPPFIRFHLTQLPKTTSSPPHPLLSYLKGATLKHAFTLQGDRILELIFSTSDGEKKLIAEFFSKHPNYYLIDEKGKILLTLHPSHHTHYTLPSLHSFPQSPPHWHSHREVEEAYEVFENEWELTKEKQYLNTLLSKQIKCLEKKEEKLINELKRCDEWEKVQHEADLIKSQFNLLKKGISSISVHDWMTNQMHELILDPIKTPLEEMTARYKLAKKLHAGKEPLSKHLTATQDQLELMKERLELLKLVDTEEALVKYKEELPLPHHPKQTLTKSDAPPVVYKEYRSISGVKIWVGKNGKANEQLTFQLANGRDWWLHVKGYPGSHVIIRMNKDQEPDTETLKDAFQLALYHSKGRHQGEGEICFTQRKYVSRLGQKKIGQVQISKHQTAWVRLDSVRLQTLKNFCNTENPSVSLFQKKHQ